MLTIIGVIATIAVIGGIFWYFLYGEQMPEPITTTQDETSYYSFNDAGLSFTYPRTYTFESYPLEDDTESWISLMLMRTKDKQEAEANGASEGPVAVTIGIFPNDSHQDLEQWIKTNQHSNFDLSADQKLTPRMLGGEPGFEYTHSGLYEYDAFAVAHNNSIYLFEVSWADAGDPIRSDFQNLLNTVHFK